MAHRFTLTELKQQADRMALEIEATRMGERLKGFLDRYEAALKSLEDDMRDNPCLLSEATEEMLQGDMKGIEIKIIWTGLF